MNPNKSTWGGADRGQGRKPLDPDDATVVVTVRLTLAQKAKLATLGGAAWVRERIEKARQP